ncbi:MAG: hypothetical protein FD136_668 [Chitinophagaceae bacterium]|nr:MAG: hypothetical protein FD136_668 [Chitinophagaceae bacterium]
MLKGVLNILPQVGLGMFLFEIIPIVLSSPDFYEVGNNNRRRNKAILFKKIINNKIYHVIMSIVNKSGENILMFNTMYIKKADEINHQP